MIEPVGIGLVGAGAYGEFCLAAFAEVPEVRIAAICDTDAARAERFAVQYGIPAYTSLDALLEDANVEIVALNTPPFLHAQQGLRALEAGKHLFCEKPLALTLGEGQTLANAAQRAGTRLTVDYVMRQNPLWTAAANIAASGVLGKLLHMDLTNHAAGLSLPSNHWFWDKSKSGGIWVEHGVHFFDAFTWVAGTSGHITASNAFTNDAGHIDRVEALATYGETAAHFYHGFTHSGASEQTTARLAFQRGYITLYEWVPTLMKISAVAPEVADSLSAVLPGTVNLEPMQHDLYHVTARLTEGKSAVYRECVQRGIRDFALAVRLPHHVLSVNVDHALDSLRLAIEADTLSNRTPPVG